MDEIDEVIISKNTLTAIANEKRKFENKFFEKIYLDFCRLLLDFIQIEKIDNIKSKDMVTKWELFKEKKAIEYVDKNHKELLSQIKCIINSSNLKDINFDYFKENNLNKIEFKFLKQKKFKFIEYSNKDDLHLMPKQLHEFIYFLNCNIANYNKIEYSDELIKLCRKIFDIEAKDNLDPIYQY